MVAGNNCVLSIPNYGKAALRVEQVVTGLSLFNIAATNTEQSRTRRHYFTSHRTSGSFTITVLFTSHKAQENFTNWLEKYARWSAEPNTNSSPIRVVIPTRKFDKTGVLSETLSYGDEVKKVLRRVEIGFMGGRDAVDLSENSSLLSVFNQSIVDPALVRLYPASSATASANSWDKVGTVSDRDFGGVRAI